MVRLSAFARVQISRIATPPREELGRDVEHKTKDFFREVCRTLPWVIAKYRLDELTTVRELQKVIEKRFRDNWFVRDPRAIDLLVFKGKEELDMVQRQHKQRHHLINDYVVGPQQERAVEELERQENLSKYMKSFYINDV